MVFYIGGIKMTINEINSSNFKEKISKGKVLVDFWANWCGPCRQLSPILNEISEELNDIQFTKLDVDKNTDIAQEFEIRGIPTLILFQNGKEIKRISGLHSKEDLKKELK